MKKVILAVLTAVLIGAGSAAYANPFGTPPWETYHDDNSVAGPVGPVGPAGAQGNQGNRGATGATGSRGYTGRTGATGQTGATGVAGVDGTNGTNGATGATGATGSAGVDGTFNSDRLDFGLASASALANIPGDVGAGNTAIGVGMGFYNKTDAVALGLVHQFNSNWIAKASVAQSLNKQGDDVGYHALWGVGAAYRF